MDFQNRVAIISGATGGLGRVAVQSLAEQGVRVALIGTQNQKLEDLARELSLPADGHLNLALDLGVPNAAAQAVQAVIDKFGRVDILLHLVGGWIGGKPVTEVAPSQVSEMLQQHLWTTLYLAQALVPHLVENHWGRLVVISSPTASHPAAQRAPYAIGKAAQEALILTLAQELKGTGVTANLLVVNTIDVKHERDKQPSPQNSTWTTPEEITRAILYICSEEGRVVNGARIPLFGSPL